MAEYQMQLPDPKVDVANATEVALGITVIENEGVDLVPNIGVITGSAGVLIVDTGIGTENAEAVLQYASDVAKGRRLYLTTTHFHPEHAFGAQVMAGQAHYVLNRAQAEDLQVRGPGYLENFRGMAETIAHRLEGVRIPAPDEVYDGDSYELDLGGVLVRLLPTGRGHTAGDQVVLVPGSGVLFTGDLAETQQFPIFPYFPPYDTDVSGSGWIAVMERLASMGPRIVVPGHGSISDAHLLETVRDAIVELRDETGEGLSAGLEGDALVKRVSSTLTAAHPDWRGREWIATAVGSFAAQWAVTETTGA